MGHSFKYFGFVGLWARDSLFLLENRELNSPVVLFFVFIFYCNTIGMSCYQFL